MRKKETGESVLPDWILDQKRLGGAPPICRSKCMNCEPCKPVHVPVPPSQIMEYYPEAWRCKCGNKLFIP